MNEAERKKCDLLRSMESFDAVEWLLQNHPKDGCMYIAKRSWKKAEQLRLARHFLAGIPHASAICYQALLSVMSVSRFVGIVKELIPEGKKDRELLEYYLIPALLTAAKTDKDQLYILGLKSELQN